MCSVGLALIQGLPLWSGYYGIVTDELREHRIDFAML